ncbi:putative uncharacterized protein DDB_G0271606 [Eurytemora carolleeae]|uniref:putative uncharacterized protein DDB_G0271606 n=1 Tax=Eurytemora carolleeae TaxID=1294199 RepID=UPI000C76F8E7|nr:putative uncharacterized protein DDB_G0271606 [Eurytemora carolleeae]|eukprot:XP_023322366.1 putative uncharacterized protein DDB_G0271606 [Eurytemora affinis]
MDWGDVLECSICLEQLSESNKVLPCQHTFCTQCLQDVIKKKGSLLCPECRSPVTVEISSLPSNILLNRLLEGLKQSERSLAAAPKINVKKETQSDPLNQSHLQPSQNSRVSNINSHASLISSNTPKFGLNSPTIQAVIKTESESSIVYPPTLNQNIFSSTLQDNCEKSTNCWSQPTSDLTGLTAVSRGQSIQGIQSSTIPQISTDITGSSSNLTTLFASCSLGPGSNTSCTSAHLSTASNSIVDSTSSIHFHTPAHSSSSFNPSSPLHSSSSLHLSSPLHSSSAFHSSSSFYPSSPLNSSLPTALQPSYISSATRPSLISSRSLLTPSVLIQPQDLQPHTSSLIPSRPPYLAPSSSGPAQPSSGFSSQGSSPLHASPIQGNLNTNPFLDLLNVSNPSSASNKDTEADIKLLPPPPEVPERPLLNPLKGWQLSPRALIHPPGSIQQQQQPFMQQQQCLQQVKQHQTPLQQQLQLSLHQQQTPLQKVQQPRTLQQQQQQQQQQSKLSLHKPLTLNPFDFSTSSLSNRQQPTAQTDLSQQQQLSPSPQPQQQQWTPHRSVELHHQIYKAIYDFNATQPDELSLRKGKLYLVTELCQDGWNRGKCLSTGKSGVFPGNHLEKWSGSSQEIAGTKKNQTTEETEEERTEKLKNLRETLKKTHAQNISRSHSNADQSKGLRSKGERYRCVVPFPASSDYEIELQVGDVISLVKRREDGWCKGILHRTGKTGLFPSSFVERVG